MKIELLQLEESVPFPIEIQGNEDWLKPLYEEFPPHSKKEVLSGSLFVIRFEDGYTLVQGSFSYKPQNPCSRCSKPMEHPVNETIKIGFVPKKESFQKELELTAQDMDECFLEVPEINIDALLRESILLSFPTHTTTEGENGCPACLQQADSNSALYSSSKESKPNPFAALTQLSLENSP